MSGHSKWSTIKHKKAVVDVKRSKEFGKLARLISAESRLVGGDISSPSLRAVVEKAKAANMPKENIERAIKKGAGINSEESEQVLYELYGPGGTAVLIETFTDNKNRTVQELRHLVSAFGYELASSGSALWAFSKAGAGWSPSTTIPISNKDFEMLDELVSALLAHNDVDDVFINAVHI